MTFQKNVVEFLMSIQLAMKSQQLSLWEKTRLRQVSLFGLVSKGKIWNDGRFAISSMLICKLWIMKTSMKLKDVILNKEYVKPSLRIVTPQIELVFLQSNTEQIDDDGQEHGWD